MLFLRLPLAGAVQKVEAIALPARLAHTPALLLEFLRVAAFCTGKAPDSLIARLAKLLAQVPGAPARIGADLGRQDRLPGAALRTYVWGTHDVRIAFFTCR